MNSSPHSLSMKKVGYVAYRETYNIGDIIQSLVVQSIIHEHGFSPALIDRERSNDREPVEHAIVNGWFAHDVDNTFPLGVASPLVIGFHLDKWSYEGFVHNQLEKWRSLQWPIGCRDPFTLQFLSSLGLDCYLSGCPTILSHKILSSPLFKEFLATSVNHPIEDEVISNSVLCIDYNPSTFYNRLYRKSYEIVNISALLPPIIQSYSRKVEFTLQYLSFISNWHGLIVTTRLHAILPALSLGKSVIFYGDIRNSRISLLKSLGIAVNRFPTAFGSSKMRILANSLHCFLRPNLNSALQARPYSQAIQASSELISQNIFNYLDAID